MFALQQSPMIPHASLNPEEKRAITFKVVIFLCLSFAPLALFWFVDKTVVPCHSKFRGNLVASSIFQTYYPSILAFEAAAVTSLIVSVFSIWQYIYILEFYLRTTTSISRFSWSLLALTLLMVAGFWLLAPADNDCLVGGLMSLKGSALDDNASAFLLLTTTSVSLMAGAIFAGSAVIAITAATKPTANPVAIAPPAPPPPSPAMNIKDRLQLITYVLVVSALVSIAAVAVMHARFNLAGAAFEAAPSSSRAMSSGDTTKTLETNRIAQSPGSATIQPSISSAVKATIDSLEQLWVVTLCMTLAAMYLPAYFYLQWDPNTAVAPSSSWDTARKWIEKIVLIFSPQIFQTILQTAKL